MSDGTEITKPSAPFRIRLPDSLKRDTTALPGNSKPLNEERISKEKLVVEAYLPANPGPYPQDKPKQNTVRFTPTQVIYLSILLFLGWVAV
jgi:intron-binding protein aquarius